MRRHLTCTLLVITFAAACAPRAADEGAQATSADSAATERLLDSLSAANPPAAAPGVATKDSVAAKAPTKAPAKAPTKAPATGTIIGRDSAFGPTYTVDSTGKVTRIVPPKKKP